MAFDLACIQNFENVVQPMLHIGLFAGARWGTKMRSVQYVEHLGQPLQCWTKRTLSEVHCAPALAGLGTAVRAIRRDLAVGGETTPFKHKMTNSNVRRECGMLDTGFL